MKFETLLAGGRQRLANFRVQREEGARQKRVANHPHLPECTLSGDISLIHEIGELGHDIEVRACRECGFETRIDRTKIVSKNMRLIGGGWY